MVKSPPFPSYQTAIPHGRIGYDDQKSEQLQEAQMDRDQTEKRRVPVNEKKRFIEALHARYPHINVVAIADQITPWCVKEFKDRVAEAALRYLREL